MLYLVRSPIPVVNGIPLDEDTAWRLVEELRDLQDVTTDTIKDLEGSTDPEEINQLACHKEEWDCYTAARNWLQEALDQGR